jgi:hypothetical protein
MFCINFGKKMGWATVWAIFSQTRLVTLLSREIMIVRCQSTKSLDRLSPFSLGKHTAATRVARRFIFKQKKIWVNFRGP